MDRAETGRVRRKVHYEAAKAMQAEPALDTPSIIAITDAIVAAVMAALEEHEHRYLHLRGN